jgi:hypothetical protein
MFLIILFCTLWLFWMLSCAFSKNPDTKSFFWSAKISAIVSFWLTLIIAGLRWLIHNF